MYYCHIPHYCFVRNVTCRNIPYVAGHDRRCSYYGESGITNYHRQGFLCREFVQRGYAGFYATDNSAEAFYVSEGVLELWCDASNSGNVTWTLMYLPAEGDAVAYTTAN